MLHATAFLHDVVQHRGENLREGNSWSTYFVKGPIATCDSTLLIVTGYMNIQRIYEVEIHEVRNSGKGRYADGIFRRCDQEAWPLVRLTEYCRIGPVSQLFTEPGTHRSATKLRKIYRARVLICADDFLT